MNTTKHVFSATLIVPCLNAEQTLAATLESAVKQDIVSEILVIDDGSTDRSLAIARSFEPHVRVLSGTNRGASAARNRGIVETTKEWIVFLDADDILLPGTLASRLATARESPCDVVVCDWQDFSSADDEADVGPRRSVDWAALAADAEHAVAAGVWATTAALMYRRELVGKIGGFRADLPIIQDARFFFDAAYHGARFAHSPHVGAKYRLTPGSLSRRAPAKFWEDVLVNGQQIERLWRATGTLDRARLQTLADIYNHAARGLFAARHPRYFEAVGAQRKLGLPLPRHSRIAPPLARLIGLHAARTLVGLATRA